MLDYILVGKQLLLDGARCGVLDPAAWDIASSPHRVLGARLPLTVHRERRTRPKPLFMSRVNRFTDKPLWPEP